MKRLVIGVLLVATMFTSGCLSTVSYRSSVEQLKREPAIKAVEVDGGAGIGIDLLNLDALTLNPTRQVLAAVGDALLLYGTWSLIDEFNSSGSGGSNQRNIQVNISNSDNAMVNIEGDSDSTSTSTTTTTDTTN